VGERFFHRRDFARLPGLADCGFAALATMAAPLTEMWLASAGVEPASVRRIPDLSAVFFACRSRASARTIGAVASTVGVRACAIYHCDADQETRSLALLFADHLASVRMSDSCVVTALAPHVPLLPNRVVIPHLVGIREDPGIRDAVIWEWAAPAVLAQWTEGRAFDPHPWQERTDHLMRLRRVIRRGEPLAARHAELLRQLAGRYLSFKFVAQHESLVLAAIHDLDKTANAKTAAEWR